MENISIFRTGLSFRQLLPEDMSQYDKMRPPKKEGQPTIVHFHVTVMGLDSIDETSMVNLNLQIEKQANKMKNTSFTCSSQCVFFDLLLLK